MSHVTVLTGPERRRRWGDDAKEQILATASSPGANVASVARQFDVSTSLIYKWRRASLAPPPSMGFVPAVIAESSDKAVADNPGFPVVVELAGGTRVNLRADAPVALIGATLKALR